MTDNRKYERLPVEGAIVLDEAGRELGTVTVAGGGGFGIRLDTMMRLEPWPVGKRMRLTVVEVDTGARHDISIEIRYVHEGTLGVQFAAGDAGTCA